MHPKTVARVIGFFVVLFGLTLVAPILVSFLYGESDFGHFLVPMLGTLGLGACLLFLGRNSSGNLSNRDGFLIVALFWTIFTLLGAWPLMSSAHLGLVDALFESASGITTTGATVMTGLDHLPKSLLIYRQQLQWLGGMGLIVLGVAVLPMLGIGGMQLYRAEVPGPLKDEKITPRLAVTARALWFIYLGLTLACALGYWLAGMDLFDAVAHSLSTLSTGGFSTHDASIGYFKNPVIEQIAIVFMLIAAINFGIHFTALHRRDWSHYFHDVETRSFVIFVALTMLFVVWMLQTATEEGSLLQQGRDAAFVVTSVITSTGFGTADFSKWPGPLPVLLIFISFIGGCGGSTAGGMKVMRMLLLFGQGLHEVRRLIHPHAVMPVRIGQRVIDSRLMQSVWGFFSLYVGVFVMLMLLMMQAGLDQSSAFSAIATTMNNLGPGLGEVAYNFQTVSDTGKIVAVVAMLMGRLEIFTLLVLLSPEFWRR
ncbi:MAG: TrkH family potassium uptake protein [Gammaproteobacteria bacterium]|nr:TrkH family potassium uptake protein [Gammaproteobacteria bacterium]MBU1653327.1 TrkH family potassium uptake protein [Gammaproteobacteria bacterium]MBU1962519.1 TrkH family potassium uptake protein [Gammaproteobacteria bacterium]